MKQLNLFLMTFFCSILAIGAFSSCIDEEGPELKDSITLTVDLKDILAELKADNETAIKKLSDELQAMKEKQGASEEKITKLVNDLIDAAKGDLTKELGVLKASLKVVKDKVGVVEQVVSKVTTLEEKVQTYETAIATITEGVEGLKAAKEQLEKNQKSVDHRLKLLEGLWANLTMKGVDLGLSVRWAPMNLGATTETRFGGFYAWGELVPKDHIKGETSDFSLENYKFYKDGQWIKYNKTESRSKLEPADDAATQTLGEDWRMPTYEEFQELYTKCKWEYKERYNGTTEHGFLVTSNTTNKSIFIPCGGYFAGKHTTASRDYVDARLWTSSFFKDIDETKAVRFLNSNDLKNPNISSALGASNLVERHFGLNIRPVWDPKKK